MLEAPPLSHEHLTVCLQREYGLAAVRITFLPLGADVDTAVYRVEAAGGVRYFLKLRRHFLPASVMVPYLLSRQEGGSVIAPLPTQSGELQAQVDEFTLILTPFHDAVSGWEASLSRAQWCELGRALRALHTMEVSEHVRREIPSETYDTGARLQVSALLNETSCRTTAGSTAAAFLELVRRERPVIERLLHRASELGERLRRHPPCPVLCHGDIHAGNVLLSANRLLVVDWDTLILAPPERDLMFIGGGVGGCWNQPQEAQWFGEGYGAVAIDAVALAYYRCERIVQDMAEFAHALLEAEHGEADRQQMLQQCAAQFEPGNVVENALATGAGL